MKVIESKIIDLIEPFPLSEAGRAFTWLHCYHNILESDLTPKSAVEFELYLRAVLPFTRTFGVIDKLNRLGIKHEAPLIGLVIFQPATVWDCTLSLAAPRRAWKIGLIDDAVSASIEEIFVTEPSIARISFDTSEGNNPMKGLARRLLLRFEGCSHDAFTQNSTLKSLLHFGVTRRDWQERQLPSLSEVLPETEVI